MESTASLGCVEVPSSPSKVTLGDWHGGSAVRKAGALRKDLSSVLSTCAAGSDPVSPLWTLRTHTLMCTHPHIGIKENNYFMGMFALYVCAHA